MPTDAEIHHLRENYDREPLLEAALLPDPVAQFRAWFEEARASGIPVWDARTTAGVV
jgi:pyridoxine/pyridoxamine 5'-phosphate oxidase